MTAVPGEHAEVVLLQQADPALSSAGSETVWQFLHGSAKSADRATKNPKFGYGHGKILSGGKSKICAVPGEHPNFVLPQRADLALSSAGSETV